MAWLQLALRGARSQNEYNAFERKFLVRFEFLDGSQGDVPLTLNDTFSTLAQAIGPAGLMLFRREGAELSEISERGFVYDTLLKWQRAGDRCLRIVAARYGQFPAQTGAQSKHSYLKEKRDISITVAEPGRDRFRVKISALTTADQLARRICPSACLGLFSARREGKTHHYFHYELLPRDACISGLVDAWKSAEDPHKMIVVPLTEYADFVEDSECVDDDSGCEEDSEYDEYSEYEEDSECADEGSECAHDDREYAEAVIFADDSAGNGGITPAPAQVSGDCKANLRGVEVSGSFEVCDENSQTGKYDNCGEVGGVSGTETKSDEDTFALSPAPSVTAAPHTPHLRSMSPTLKMNGSPDSDVSGDTILPTFHDLFLRDEAEDRARVSAENAADLSSAGAKIEHSDVPVCELEMTADTLGPAATRSLSWGLINKSFLYGKDALWDPSAPLESVIHDLITEVIRLAGKGDELQLRHISEEEIYAALLCETDAQRDLVQLDVPLLACTAVSNVLSSEHAEVLELHAQIARANLHEARRTMRRGQRKHRYAAGTEARALMDIFRPMQLVVGVVEQAPRAGPAGLASRLMGAAAPPHSRPAPSPHALLFADKLTAIAEVPSYTNRAIIRKGFLVEGRYAGRIVLSIQDTNYNMRRWITPPSRNATELVRFLALAVLCSSEELRDILLAADRAIGGAVSAHYDACQEDYRRFLEEAKVRAEQVDIEDEKEREEERRYPSGPPKKIETAWPEPFKLS